MKWVCFAVLLLLPWLAIELAIMRAYEMTVLTIVIAAFTIYPVARMWPIRKSKSDSTRSSQDLGKVA